MNRRLVAACGAVLLLFAGCGSGEDAAALESQPFVALDGSPREPDDAGRLVEVAEDFSTLTVAGDGGVRRYAVDPRLQSFSAADGSTQPLIRWRNQYVQIGVRDDTVEWVSGVAAVFDVPGENPVAYFTDVLVDAAGHRLIFRSGTVLTVDDGVEPPGEPPVAVVATIDVDSDRVVALEAG